MPVVVPTIFLAALLPICKALPTVQSAVLGRANYTAAIPAKRQLTTIFLIRYCNLIGRGFEKI